MDLNNRGKQRCKNFFALGLVYWLYGRPLEPTLRWIEEKFSKVPAVAEANRRALETGYRLGETEESFAVNYHVAKAPNEPGTYRIVNGNEASALGFATAARLARKPLVYSSYPITPATDVLHELAKLKHLDVRTIQYEDEIAAMGSAIGAAFGGTFSLTGTSGPGVCLKSEAINLAIMLELPVVILNVQRGGPSTGMPTKTEQADLLQAFAGRNGESPIPILAAANPADCFDVAIEAFRIAVRHMTPVFMLTDGYIANGAEPWRIPRFEDLESIEVTHPSDPAGFLPYSRDEATLGRPWAIPGTPGLEHRLGGLEKQEGTGAVSYDPENHDRMCRLRAEKVERIADFVPEALSGRPLRRGPARSFLGGNLRGRVQRLPGSPGEGPSRGPSAPPLSEPLPARSGRSAFELQEGSHPGTQPRAAGLAGPSEVSGRRGFVHQAQRTSLHHFRGGTEDRGDALMTDAAESRALTRKDFSSGQAVRWCPGCGDYAILAQVQQTLPKLGIPRENFVIISGIGCSSRFPYYMNTYGIHSIHGRAPTLATGLKCARPDLQLWVVTGDGDSLAIGGNHFLHALRRNVDINILLFNNRIYGLTKGQYSPTSELGKRTKSSPQGSIENPVNPIGVAIGAESSFIARTVDMFQQHMSDVLLRAAEHRGATLVEIAQNCVIFNDGAWKHLTDPDAKLENVLYLEHGKPMRFGQKRQKGIRLNGFDPRWSMWLKWGRKTCSSTTRRQRSLPWPTSSPGWARPSFLPLWASSGRIDKPVHDQLLLEQVREAEAQKSSGHERTLPPGPNLGSVSGCDIEETQRCDARAAVMTTFPVRITARNATSA